MSKPRDIEEGTIIGTGFLKVPFLTITIRISLIIAVLIAHKASSASVYKVDDALTFFLSKNKILSSLSLPRNPNKHYYVQRTIKINFTPS